jgi:hypothetical protein
MRHYRPCSGNWLLKYRLWYRVTCCPGERPMFQRIRRIIGVIAWSRAKSAQRPLIVSAVNVGSGTGCRGVVISRVDQHDGALPADERNRLVSELQAELQAKKSTRKPLRRRSVTGSASFALICSPMNPKMWIRTLSGIDGLYWNKGEFLGVQYGTGVYRVMRWQLSPMAA